MNLFKKAIIATAVVATFGASAAQITPSTSILKISKEGIAANVAVPDAGFDLNVKVEALTAASSNIKIQFGAGVDLTTPKAALVATVTQTAAPNGSTVNGDMSIIFGTGSFTFDNLAIDTTTADAHFVTFDVNVGQPISNGAAFNVKFATGKVAKASNATYTATDGATVIDTGTGAIAVEKDQFSFVVKTPFDALIERTAGLGFVNPTATADSLILTATNTATLSRAITATGATALMTADFKNVVIGEVTGTAVTGLAPATIDTADKKILLTVDGAGALAATNDLTLAVDHAGTAITATGPVNVLYTVSGDFVGGTMVLNSADNGGQWKVDATIINVPYFPVGFAGTSSQINLANESTSDVDVRVSAIDQNGTVYPEVDLGLDIPKQTVTKVSQTMLMTLLGVAAETKLSVTFNVDANEGVVNGYAFTKSADGRTEISTSQQRGN